MQQRLVVAPPPARRAAAAALQSTGGGCAAAARLLKRLASRCSFSDGASTASAQAAEDEAHMRAALAQARAAFDAEEVPIGAVLVVGSEVIAAGQNATERRRNPLAHAELLAILAAAEQLQAWRLADATLYCTVEPCPMCAGAILQARLKRLVYGARQPRLGADGSWVALLPQQQPAADAAEAADDTGGAAADSVAAPLQPVGPHPFHPDMRVTRGVLEEECADLMVQFFRRRRQQAKDAKAAAAAATGARNRSGSNSEGGSRGDSSSAAAG